MVQSGWEVTVYYTAVESFHHGEPIAVTGCPVLDCENGDDPLGRYPSDFVTAVKDEGTGRITSGKHAGRYLNWSHGVGYWLDTEARNSYGDALRPFSSAATDADVLPRGSRSRSSNAATPRSPRTSARICGSRPGSSTTSSRPASAAPGTWMSTSARKTGPISPRATSTRPWRTRPYGCLVDRNPADSVETDGRPAHSGEVRWISVSPPLRGPR
ncbi:hypothetical protein BKA15_002751 [Microlunatus parietis]|uniref:Uncharacterized protein n=1 Tax=Microlunatus parietis TaxID=682979 RepID=A0A7Y9I6Z1_9ACTN|nr:hypothetical protein [Microlunatus parietis]